ncbi:MAG: hypothetical protein HY761_10090 [Candidatus Omnitrophica bacterium]|nr:hypothetical protein [Candidatus Omnitrophota bacterium]
MKLTKEQFKDIGLIDAGLRKKYPAFQGFNGSADDMQVIGVDENIILEAISNIDISKIKYENNARKESAVAKTINKLKSLGLDDEDIKLLGIKT